MTLTDLRYLVTLAELRHFAKAAAACFVSQPTLSIAIKKLEDELNLVLFERHRHDVLITPAAEPIIAQAKVVLHEADLLKQMAQAQRDEFAQPLRLGAIFTVAPLCVSQFDSCLASKCTTIIIVFRRKLYPRFKRQVGQWRIRCDFSRCAL